ncbi:MAG: carboxylesterase, partial [Gammaproteobacteria bacterium]
MTARTREQFHDISLRLYGDRSEEFLRLYAPSDDGAVKDVAADAVRDGGMASAMRAWARAQRRTGKSRVYMYVYSHGHPYAPGITFS